MQTPTHRRRNIDLPADLTPPFKEGDIIVPADAVYPEGALRVTGVDGSDLLAYPLGGGRQLRFPPAAWLTQYRFRVVTPDEIKGRKWTQLLVSIEGEPPIYKAWSDGTYWNGWEKPYMAAHNRDRFIRDWNQRSEDWSDEIGEWTARNFGNGHFAWYNEPTEEAFFIFHEGSQYIDSERFEREVKPRLLELKPLVAAGDEAAYQEMRDLMDGQLAWIERAKTIITPSGQPLKVWNIFGGMFIWSEHQLDLDDLEREIHAPAEERWDAPNDRHPFQIKPESVKEVRDSLEEGGEEPERGWGE